MNNLYLLEHMYTNNGRIAWGVYGENHQVLWIQPHPEGFIYGISVLETGWNSGKCRTKHYLIKKMINFGTECTYVRPVWD